MSTQGTMKGFFGRLPCGGVDRNLTTTALSSGCLVASRAEAWIETRYGIGRGCWMSVASRAEAWIETKSGGGDGDWYSSPPVRRRG